MPNIPINAGKYKVVVSLKSNLVDFVIIGKNEFDYEIETLKIIKPINQTKAFDKDGFTFESVTSFAKDWANYLDVKVYDKNSNLVDKVSGSWVFLNVNEYNIQIQFKDAMNTNNGGSTDNVVWSDNSKDSYQFKLTINKLVLPVNGWRNSSENKVPTIDSNFVEDINKYFDYVIYELNGDSIIGNELDLQSVLKYNTNYQISLRVKSEYRGNVAVEYNDVIAEVTAPYHFKTQINPNESDTENKTNNSPSEFFKNSPILAWTLIGVIAFLLILLIVLICILIAKHNKGGNESVKPISYEDYCKEKNINTSQDDKETDGDSNKTKSYAKIVNNNINNSDWTFVIKEKDVINLELLQYPNDDIMFYAFNANDVKKLKKFQGKLEKNNTDKEKIDDNMEPEQ